MATTYPLYVVDDDPGIHDWADIICEEHGLSCRMFTGGEEFLSAVGNLAPGCVLLDMRMPRRSGLEVQAELAKAGRGLPVIAMTGFGDVDVAVKSMQMGAIDFLEKPFPKEVLFEALELAFRRLEATHAKIPAAVSRL